MGEPSTPATPFVAVDRDVLERNIEAMAVRTRERGMAVRPHAKTHKCWEIGRRQLAAGACGLTVATVSEAEYFVASGCADVFIAYPLWADQRLGARLRALGERCALRVGVDSVEGAEALAQHAGAASLKVLVEVDSGHHRTGVAPSAAGDVALGAARAGLTVRGAFTFPGHSYAPDRTRRAGEDEAAALGAAVAGIRAAGLSV